MKKYAFLFSLIVLFNSCKTELDVLADWKETTIVYGLLNQADSTHYIKVNKAFLGEGNALEMAQVFDSINYANSLNVKIDRWKNGNIQESYSLIQDATIPKDPGMFSNPGQVLFKFNASLDDESEYSLNIHNTKTNNILTARTSLVGDFIIDKPSPALPSVSFTHPTVPHKVIWKTAANGRLYDFVLRFNYTEVDIATSDTAFKYVDISFGSQKSRSLNGGETMEVAFLGETFYETLSRYIQPNSAVRRYTGTLDYIFSVAADDFSTYLEVNQPSTGIVQEKPEYTNITNGIGIFSARYNKMVSNVALNLPSKDSLKLGRYTKNLGFQ